MIYNQNPDERGLLLDTLNDLVGMIYAAINQETPLNDIITLIKNNYFTRFESLLEFDLNHETLKALAYQTREMIVSEGKCKTRGSNRLYATHPIAVAMIAAKLAELCNVSLTTKKNAILLGLYHDVIEEGNRVNNWQQVFTQTNCQQEIAMNIVLLDNPKIVHPNDPALSRGLKSYIAFAHLVTKQRDTAVKLAELSDRIDGVLDIDFILKREPGKRVRKLIQSLSCWRYMVREICTKNRKLAPCKAIYEQCEASALKDHRAQAVWESESINRRVEATVEYMQEFSQQYAGYYECALHAFVGQQQLCPVTVFGN